MKLVATKNRKSFRFYYAKRGKRIIDAMASIYDIQKEDFVNIYVPASWDNEIIKKLRGYLAYKGIKYRIKR